MLKDVRLCAEEAKALDVPDAVMRACSINGKRPTSTRRGCRFHGNCQNDRTARGCCGFGEKGMSDDVHEVYAICYGTHARKRSENYIFGDPHDEMTSIAYYVWVIQGPHGTFVCDTGFDEVAAKERARKITAPGGRRDKGTRPAARQGRSRHRDPQHWDYAGNYDLFPNARHIQDTEMAYATGRCMCHQMLRIPFSESDVLAMVRKVFAYRVESHDGVDELAPASRCTRSEAIRGVCNACASRPQTRLCRCRLR